MSALSVIKIKVCKFLLGISVGVWFLVGCLVLISVVNDYNRLQINLTLGIMFIAIACYLFFKSKNGTALPLLSKDIEDSKEFIKLMYLDLVFSLLILCFGLLILMGGIFRVFIEKIAVFV